MLCLLGPLLLGADFGWAPWLFAVMAAGLLMLALLWPLERRIERRRNGLPLIHLALLQDRSFAIGLLVVFFFTFANISFYLVLTLYMQLGLGFTPLQSGTTMLPSAIAFAIVSRMAGPRAQRRGVSALIEGCGVQIAGLAALGAAIAVFPPPEPSQLAFLLVIFGAGQAMVMAPLYGIVLTKVPTAHAGSGGGVLSTVQQVGNASGVAVIGALFYAVLASDSARYAFLACVSTLAVAIAITAGFLHVLSPVRPQES